jgi:hypothetical protein
VKADLPPVPAISPDLLAGHRAAHARLEEGLCTAYEPVARLLTRFAYRTTIASVAHVRLSLRGQSRPPLFPTPRSFLSATDLARLAGTAAAYRHVDSRLTMVRDGHDSAPALRPETPYVLHALSEGRMDNADETNPGMIRGREYERDHLPVAPYPPPPRQRLRTLLDRAVDVAVTQDSPAGVRAAWLLFTVGEIHPFQDGNGRVARLLYLLVAGEEMPRTVDWGVSEQLRFHEDRLTEAFRQRDPAPTVFTVLELSTQGAHLMADRLACLGAVVPELARRLGVGVDGAVLVTATWLRRMAHPGDLALDVGRVYPEVLASTEALVAHGALARSFVHGSARPSPAQPEYVLAAGAGAEIRRLVVGLQAG